jgi:ATP-dependent Lon protease
MSTDPRLNTEEPMAEQNSTSSSLPEDVLIILPVSDVVLFPGVVLPVSLTGKHALAAAQEAVRTRRRVGLVLQSGPGDESAPEQMHRVGTIASIVRFVTAADGTHHLIAQGEQRFTMLETVSREPFIVARIEPHREPTVLDREIEARGVALRERALEAVQLLPQAPAELGNAIRAIESIPTLADIVASFMDLKAPAKQEVLATFDLKATSAPEKRSISGRKRLYCASAYTRSRRSSATARVKARSSTTSRRRSSMRRCPRRRRSKRSASSHGSSACPKAPPTTP